MKSFPEKFLCFNRYMHTGSWFSLMPVDSSHVIQYNEEFGWETGPSTHTLECSENLPDFHGRPLAGGWDSDILEGDPFGLLFLQLYTGRGRKRALTVCSEDETSCAPSPRPCEYQGELVIFTKQPSFWLYQQRFGRGNVFIWRTWIHIWKVTETPEPLILAVK